MQSQDLFDSQGDEMFEKAIHSEEIFKIAKQAKKQNSKVTFKLTDQPETFQAYVQDVRSPKNQTRISFKKVTPQKERFSFKKISSEQILSLQSLINVVNDISSQESSVSSHQSFVHLPNNQLGLTQTNTSVDLSNTLPNNDSPISNSSSQSISQSQSQFSSNPENTSTPLDWEDEVAMQQCAQQWPSQLPEPTLDSFLRSPPPQPDPYYQPPLETALLVNPHLLADNVTIDEDYLKMVWQADLSSNSTFHQWCDKKGITHYMNQHKLQFGKSIMYKHILQADPPSALDRYNRWFNNFEDHKLPFDKWFTNYSTPSPLAQPPILIPTNDFIDIPAWHMQSVNIAEGAPPRERDRLHQLRINWSRTLMRTHAVPFQEWLEMPLPTQEFQKIQNSILAAPKLANPPLMPYHDLFIMDFDCLLTDLNQLADFILDNHQKLQLAKPIANPSLADFAPSGRFGKIYFPNYIYIPNIVYSMLQLNQFVDYTHIRNLLWNRLKCSFATAYQANPELWSGYEPSSTLSPLTRQFSTQTKQDYLQVTIGQVAQQEQAHEYLRRVSGLKNITHTEFYDLFIRPLEFLVGRGMPLHKFLQRAAFNAKDRFHLFKILVEMAGFSNSLTILDDIPCDPHFVFMELSKIRHLDGANLTISYNPGSAPYARTEPLPKVPDYHISTKTPIGPIDPLDFAPHGRFAHLQISQNRPIPKEVFVQFPNLPTDKITVHDYVSLHKELLKAKKNFLAGNYEAQAPSTAKLIRKLPTKRPLDIRNAPSPNSSLSSASRPPPKKAIHKADKPSPAKLVHLQQPQPIPKERQYPPPTTQQKHDLQENPLIYQKQLNQNPSNNIEESNDSSDDFLIIAESSSSSPTLTEKAPRDTAMPGPIAPPCPLEIPPVPPNPYTFPQWLNVKAHMEEILHEPITLTQLLQFDSPDDYPAFWTTQRSSAAKIHLSLVRDPETTYPGRYYQIKHVIRIPLDTHTTEMDCSFKYYKKNDEGFINITTSQTLRQKEFRGTKNKVKPLVTTMLLPLSYLEHFINLLCEALFTRFEGYGGDFMISPKDPMSQGAHQSAECLSRYSIYSKVDELNSERTVQVTFQENKSPPDLPLATLSFPWIHFGDVVCALGALTRSLHSEKLYYLEDLLLPDFIPTRLLQIQQERCTRFDYVASQIKITNSDVSDEDSQ